MATMREPPSIPSSIAGSSSSARSSFLLQVRLSLRDSARRSSRKTFSIGPTSTSGCRTMRISMQQIKPRLQVEQIVKDEAAQFSKEHRGSNGEKGDVLRYVTTFVGGGGPRFWFSASPQLQQLNYAQVLIEVKDKEMTPQFIKELQPKLSASIPGARLDARQLLTNPVDYPIEIRISSTADANTANEAEDIRGLRAISSKVEAIFRSIPIAERTRNEWGEDNAQISLTIDPDRANMAGITNMDVANSSTSALSGSNVAVLQEGQKQIPVAARLRMDERAQLSDIQNLYVYGSQENTKIPLGSDIEDRSRTRHWSHRSSGTVPHDQRSQLSRVRSSKFRSAEASDAKVAGIAEFVAARISHPDWR